MVQQPLVTLTYQHVDVFSPLPYSGNSLAVFLDCPSLTVEQMRRITQELRHFESIFLSPLQRDHEARARVFDLFGELDFAGHPLLGAACALHASSSQEDTALWTIHLPARTVSVMTSHHGDSYTAVLDQGQPVFLAPVPTEKTAAFAAALNLHLEDLSATLPMEDVATGSGAGTVAAYLARHGRIPLGQETILSQGRFTGRPSRIRIRADGTAASIHRVLVGGDVAFVGQGTLATLPREEVV
jgi:trans-2,3-dihydro-3-hydroxyanthranilate isomerase